MLLQTILAVKSPFKATQLTDFSHRAFDYNRNWILSLKNRTGKIKGNDEKQQWQWYE